MLPTTLVDQLAQRKRQFGYRTRVPVQPQGSCIRIGQSTYVNFSGNDYLGLASDETLLKDCQALKLNLGSTGSPLINGYHPAHLALEEALCDWLGFDRCLLFSSGFSVNECVLKTLMQNPNDVILQDKLNHASLIDGAQQAVAQHQRFKHNDMAHLESRLKKINCYSLVVSEGVFSMDGDQAPLAQLTKQCHTYQAGLMIDDAHGLGVLGGQGQGSLGQQNICSQQVDIFTATFGKAIGSSGAFVAGSDQLIEYLVNHARSYIFSTAFSPWQAAATHLAVKKVIAESWRRERLQQNIVYFKQQMQFFELADTGSSSHIQPVIVGSNQTALALAEDLRRSGFWVTAIRPPTVPVGQARIRITLTSLHKKSQIQALCKQIAVSLKNHKCLLEQSDLNVFSDLSDHNNFQEPNNDLQ
ncbi:aminotransferase class I/II-fold pyridoxal phosphate-dependent enzyme [Gayadomonas joobiniege]|uniref:aminotransferase class I/II-fold pyridoxal phosphate-dependent enzyme n=1 Tax=Gayadomonas joobiniege TaxID=1234606 RepID=UPI000372D2A7|nr:8-amino-7-oxononanoate synthase [Gayadomonas joobiniege]